MIIDSIMKATDDYKLFKSYQWGYVMCCTYKLIYDIECDYKDISCVGCPADSEFNVAGLLGKLRV